MLQLSMSKMRANILVFILPERLNKGLSKIDSSMRGGHVIASLTGKFNKIK